MDFLFSSLARCSKLCLGILVSLTTGIAIAGGTIELRLNNTPLVNQQVIDYKEGSVYSTDADGRLVFPDSCAAMEYTDANGVGYRMLRFCGVSSDVPSINLTLKRQ